MDPSSAGDEALRHLRAWLDSLSQSEIDAIVAQSGDEIAELDAAELELLKGDTDCVFGWVHTEDGGYEELAGWIGIPSLVVTAFGGVELADDVVEIVPIGSPGHLRGIRARWSVYDASNLNSTIAVRTRDGVEHVLVAAHSGSAFTVDFSAGHAVPVGGEGLLFAVALSAEVAPRSEDLLAVDTIEIVVQRWATMLPASSGGRVTRGRGTGKGTERWAAWTLDSLKADSLGIDSSVRMRREGSTIVIQIDRLRPDVGVEASVDGVVWTNFVADADGHLEARLQIQEAGDVLRLQLRAM